MIIKSKSIFNIKVNNKIMCTTSRTRMEKKIKLLRARVANSLMIKFGKSFHVFFCKQQCDCKSSQNEIINVQTKHNFTITLDMIKIIMIAVCAS